MSWKKLKTTKLFEHPRIQIYEDDVELPSGQPTKYMYFKGHPEAAMVIAINNKGKILVQKEYSYPPNKWLYQFPGGAQNKGESNEQTAARELAEEANLRGELHSIGWFYFDNRRSSAKLHVFVATNAQAIGDSVHSKDEEEEFEDYWYSPQEINHRIKAGEIVNYSLLSAWAIFVTSDFYKTI